MKFCGVAMEKREKISAMMILAVVVVWGKIIFACWFFSQLRSYCRIDKKNEWYNFSYMKNNYFQHRWTLVRLNFHFFMSKLFFYRQRVKIWFCCMRHFRLIKCTFFLAHHGNDRGISDFFMLLLNLLKIFIGRGR